MFRSRLCMLVGLVLLGGCAGDGRTVEVAPPVEVEAPVAPASEDTDPLFPRVLVKTSRGSLLLELNANEAPETALNFVQLARDGFYEGTVFHRVVSEVLVQGGSHTPDMQVKPCTLKPALEEPSDRGSLPNERFAVALIRGGSPTFRDTEFYINFKDNFDLDEPEHRGRFRVFGKVVDGFFTLEKIRTTPVTAHPDYAGGRSAVVPVEPIVIQSVELATPLDAVAIQRHAQKRIEDRDNRLEYRIRELESETGNKRVVTETGLVYVDHRMGRGAEPFLTDTVFFHYHGTLEDGTVFESTKWKEPARRRLAELVTGLQQGMLTMREGGLRTMILPPALGFPEGIPGRIPPNATILFEIELIEIGEAPEEEP